jgi:hypothetical protein
MYIQNDIVPLVVKPKQACSMLDCGMTRLFDLLHRDELESFKDGGRWITTASIRDYVARQVERSRETGRWAALPPIDAEHGDLGEASPQPAQPRQRAPYRRQPKRQEGALPPSDPRPPLDDGVTDLWRGSPDDGGER